MRSKTRATFLAVVGTGVAAGAAPLRAQGTKVRIAGLLYDPFAEPWYIKESGAFGRAGVDVDITSLASGGAVSAALAGGALDLGIMDMITGVSAINAGVPITLLAGSALYLSTDNNVWIAVLKDSAIKGPRDLVGKTFAVPTLVGQTALGVRAWMVHNGLSPDTLKLIEMGNGAAFAAMQRGSVDATLLGEPFLTQYRAEVRDIGHPFDLIAKRYMFGAYYAPKSWIDADRDRARHTVAAIYEGARWANTHRAETMTVLVREGKFDPEKIKNIIRTTFATELTPPLVQPMLDLAADYKVIDKHYDASSIIAKV
jgi:NitT/TauT family transport system substrate-binding protein